MTILMKYHVPDHLINYFRKADKVLGYTERMNHHGTVR